MQFHSFVVCQYYCAAVHMVTYELNTFTRCLTACQFEAPIFKVRYVPRLDNSDCIFFLSLHIPKVKRSVKLRGLVNPGYHTNTAYNNKQNKQLVYRHN